MKIIAFLVKHILLQSILICFIVSSASSFECTENGYYRDPTDCAKMIRCSNGKVTHRFSCGEGKVFNDITKSCEEPKYVNCQNSMPVIFPNASPSSVTYEEETPELLLNQSLFATIATTQSNFASYTETILKTTETSDIVETETTELPETTEIEMNYTEAIASINSKKTNVDILEVENNTKLILDAFVETNVSTIATPIVATLVSNDNYTVDETSVTTETSADETTEKSSISQNQTIQLKPKDEISCYVDKSETESSSLSPLTETRQLSNIYKIVCYFTNWSRYRVGIGKYTVRHVNPLLCTHIIYAFAILDNETLTLKPSDECTDIKNNFYAQIVSLKQTNPTLKVMIALGGWVDSESDKYSRLVSNDTARNHFVKHAIQFILKHKFDGLDLDWEFPKCWQSNCASGPDSDKHNFARLIKELRKAINRQSVPLLLTAAVSANDIIIDAAYDVPSLVTNLDFINLMAYDYHTTGSRNALHHSPVYSRPNSANYVEQIFHANHSTYYWIRKGIPTYKIILGIPFYGRTFKLVNANINDMGAAVNGSGDGGQYTQEGGFLSYYEICTAIVEKGWAKRVDSYMKGGSQMQTGPYAYDNHEWVGYDDRDHLIQKSRFIKNNNLGGAMIWSLDLDDFNGICCQIKSPLLITLNHELRGYSTDLNFLCP